MYVISLRSFHLCHVISFVSCHFVCVMSFHLRHIMSYCHVISFVSCHFICVMSCHFIHVISFVSCHFINVISFISYYVMSFHLCNVISFISYYFMSFHIVISFVSCHLSMSFHLCHSKNVPPKVTLSRPRRGGGRDSLKGLRPHRRHCVLQCHPSPLHRRCSRPWGLRPRACSGHACGPRGLVRPHARKLPAPSGGGGRSRDSSSRPCRCGYGRISSRRCCPFAGAWVAERL